MAYEIVRTLFGDEVLNTAPKCRVEGCGRPADNSGYGRYHKLCSFHHKSKYDMNNWHYKKYRKDYCENIDGRLGFVCTSTIIEPRWQLETDHIDGDRKNNVPENLQTLCPCCHRYKTKLRQENLKYEKRKHVLDEKLKVMKNVAV